MIPIRRIFLSPTSLGSCTSVGMKSSTSFRYADMEYGYICLYMLQICLHMCIFVCLLCIWHRTLDTDEWLELTCNYRVRSQAPQNPIGSCLCGFLLKSYCMQLALTIFKRYRRLHICHLIYTILNSTCVKHCTLNYDIHAQQNPLDLALGALSASLGWQRIPFTELKLIKSTIRLTNGSDEHQIRLDLTLCFKDCHIVHDVIHLSHLVNLIWFVLP